MSFLKVPKFLTDHKEWLRRIANTLNDVMDGRTNNTGDVTLTANTTTTTVNDVLVSDNSVILFMPTTANAASELGAGGMYVSTITSGTSFVITHANAATVDRTFRYVRIG